MRQWTTPATPMIGLSRALPPICDASRPTRDGVTMDHLQSMVMWYFVAAFVVLTVDGLVMRWVEQGQPDPLKNLDRTPVARQPRREFS